MVRLAIYYAPRPDDPLTRLGSAWLGRDPVSNAPVPQPTLDRIEEITEEPRCYGFHATLKPPMHLADGCSWADFLQAVRATAATIPPFELPPLMVADLRGFLALRETLPCPALSRLADACVEQLDRFRAPPKPAELSRRRRAKLTAEQDAMLVRWGYPYVFNAWFFHMTLTRRLSDVEKTLVMPAVEAWFATAVSVRRRVQDICIFTQASPAAPFILAERVALRG